MLINNNNNNIMMIVRIEQHEILVLLKTESIF